MRDDPGAAIEATFQRIRRPLQWPMENFQRRHIATKGFVGYRFSRVHRKARAGFAFGFALREGRLPAVSDPPEVVAYAYVRPAPSALHDELVVRRGSAARRLVAASRRSGLRFEFFPDEEIVAVRHRSLRAVPREIFPFVASDFFMLCYEPLRASGFLERVTKATRRPTL